VLRPAAFKTKASKKDGFLIDLTADAQEAEIKWPLAVTAAVWDKYLAWTESDNKRQTYQDQSGRIWDMLSMLRMSIRQSNSDSRQIGFRFYVVPRGGKGQKARLTTLKAAVNPGDNLEPVITIMLLNEN
jgi:hypothetical protein